MTSEEEQAILNKINEEAIDEKAAIEDLVASRGWGIIKPILESKIDSLKFKIDESDDPYVVMACVRQIDGVNFVKEVISGIITRGDEAARAL